MLVQSPGFADLAFEPIAGYGRFENPFGNRDDHLSRGIAMRQFYPGYTQGIGNKRLAILEKPADKRLAFQAFRSVECMPGSVHKVMIDVRKYKNKTSGVA